jgi:2-polyprenyl-3-methyl-5-hydroxy-6-metoxy-1,4-benzoquinol methylase
MEKLYNEKSFIDSQLNVKDVREKELNKHVLKWLPNKGKLLNVGCGPFQETELLKNHGLELYAVDISKKAINLVRDKCKKAEVADARIKIPFDDNFFDVVYSIEVLEHLGQVLHFFKEMGRVAKPDGILIMSCPLLSWWKYRLKILLGKDIFDDYHCRYFTIESIRKRMEEGGFKLVDYEVAGRFRYIKKSLCGHIFLKGIKIRNSK